MIAPQPPVGLDDDDIGEQHHAAGDDARQRRPVQAERRQAEVAEHQRPATERSEEHTSELQSLMRTSYAVFRLQTNIRLAALLLLRQTELSHALHQRYSPPHST